MKTIVLTLILLTSPLYSKEVFVELLENTKIYVDARERIINKTYSNIKIKSHILSYTQTGEGSFRDQKETRVSLISIPLKNIDISKITVGEYIRKGQYAVAIVIKNSDSTKITVSYKSTTNTEGRITNRSNDMIAGQIHIDLGLKENADKFMLSFKEYLTNND